MASERCASPIRRRPSFQVIMSMKMPPPINSGNQPPCGSFSRLEAKKAKSMTKKAEVAPMHSASGSFQA